ncbi:hypothetical protein COB87_000815 [Candidatus Wolfebacteria bacterium]|nr:hypothetical protein [Candidatus Wolfebacteria bacterium]
MKELFLGTILLTLVGIVGFLYQYAKDTPRGPIACTLEARICPDGSTVGRTGPNCEFRACSSR